MGMDENTPGLFFSQNALNMIFVPVIWTSFLIFVPVKKNFEKHPCKYGNKLEILFLKLNFFSFQNSENSFFKLKKSEKKLKIIKKFRKKTVKIKIYEKTSENYILEN